MTHKFLLVMIFSNPIHINSSCAPAIGNISPLAKPSETCRDTPNKTWTDRRGCGGVAGQILICVRRWPAALAPGNAELGSPPCPTGRQGVCLADPAARQSKSGRLSGPVHPLLLNVPEQTSSTGGDLIQSEVLQPYSPTHTPAKLGCNPSTSDRIL